MRPMLDLVIVSFIYFVNVQCGAPTISPLSSNNDCQNCIIGENASKLKIICTVNSTTDPDNVTMKINDEVLHPIQHNDDHVVFVYLNSSKHHLEQLECTAIYNTTNITTQATIYVIIMTYKAPSVILPNKLIEGTPGNISCLVEDRRPAADNITMRIGGNLVEAAVTVQESSITGTLYNTWVTVTEIQRAWNKKNVTCCEYNTRFWTDDFKMCSKETDDVISYIFPPASVKLTLQLVNNITEEKPFTILKATCSIEDSNPKCDASWDTSNIKILMNGEEKSTQNIDNGSITSIFTAFMNVSASDDGKVITCSPNCTTKFNNMPSSSVEIQILGHSDDKTLTTVPNQSVLYSSTQLDEGTVFGSNYTIMENLSKSDQISMYVIIASAGGSVSLLIAIAVITVYTCRRKKRGNPVQDTNTSTNNTNTQNANNEYDMTVYEQCDQKPTLNDEPREQHNTENEYSVARDVNIVNDSGAEGEGIYNHINQGRVKPIPDDNYSHLPALNQNQSSAIVDETYAHLANSSPTQNKAAYITDATYSHVPVVHKSQHATAVIVGDDGNQDTLNSVVNKETADKSKPDFCVHDSDYDNI